MGHRTDVETVRRVLDEVVAEEPARVDRRAASGMLCGRYTEHGKPCCLVGEMLYRMGYSIGRLKVLDRAADGNPVQLRGSDLGRRFTPLAFDLLCYLQRLNDWGWSWERIREDALSISGGWARHRRYRYRGKEWLAETPALNLADYEGGSE